MVVTHKGIKLPATAVKTSLEGIREIESASSAFEVVGIDEVQFWSNGTEMAKMLDRLADSGKIVYISLLNRDHTGEPFEGTGETISRSDEVYSLTAICPKCGEEATFTQRMSDGKPVFGEVIFVGGKESYEPRCRKCLQGPLAHERVHLRGSPAPICFV